MRTEEGLSRDGWRRTHLRDSRSSPWWRHGFPRPFNICRPQSVFRFCQGWFKNAGTLLLTGSLWSKTGLLDSPYLELLPWAARHPFEFWCFVILAVLFIGTGALRMVRASAVCASILAVLLLPGLLLVLLATARGVYLQEWYLSSMLPGVVTAARHRNGDRAVRAPTPPSDCAGPRFRLPCSSSPAMRRSLAGYGIV